MPPRGNSAISEWLFVISYKVRPSTESTEERRGLHAAILATGTSLRFEIVTDLLPGHQSVFNGWVVVGLDWPKRSNPGKYVWVHTV